MLHKATVSLVPVAQIFDCTFVLCHELMYKNIEHVIVYDKRWSKAGARDIHISLANTPQCYCTIGFLSLFFHAEYTFSENIATHKFCTSLQLIRPVIV